MALTKEDLQAIRAMMQEGMESINGRLDDLENGQQAIRGDIGNLYQNHNKHMAIGAAIRNAKCTSKAVTS